MYIVYAIRSQVRDYVYVGMTNNLERRFSQHNCGKVKSTKAFRPFEMIYVEEHKTRPEARNREKYLKSGIGKEFLRNI